MPFLVWMALAAVLLVIVVSQRTTKATAVASIITVWLLLFTALTVQR